MLPEVRGISVSSYQVITENIAVHATKQEVERLLRHWQDLFSKHGRIPTYAEFNMNAFPDCQGHVKVLLPVGDDYFYMYYGRDLARDTGCDMTGRRLSDLSDSVGFKYKAVYDECLRNNKPGLTVHAAEYKITVHSWERLVLPLAGITDNERILLVYNAPRETKHDILDAILQASTNGILAITPVFETDNRICDGVIIASNKAVETIVGVASDDLMNARLLETFPGLIENGVWDRYRAVFETGVADQFEVSFAVDETETIFQVGVSAFTGGLTVTFADIGELVRANQSLERQRAEMLRANEELEKQARELSTLARELESSRSTLHQEVKRREELEEELRQIANTDELTGVPNRRSFTELSNQELKRAARFGGPVSVVVLDVDRFKSFNDTYGHAIGDHVLRIVGRRIAECLRVNLDIYGRIGGEEFAILLPETERDGAYQAAERIRQKIEESLIGVDGALLRVTASFGVATWAGFGESLQGVLNRADAALYSAKRLGRNRVEVDLPLPNMDDEIIVVERT